jgi:GH25 family lysozyme M1 (1,4-beta-N-acetylmuramidase)
MLITNAPLMRGVDVSVYQTKVDWRQLVIDGYGGFAYAKATEGAWTDGMHATHILNAVRAGVPVGSYAFGHPLQDVETSVDTFLRVVDAQHSPTDRLRHVIDMESLATDDNGQKIVPPNAGEWADRWCELMKFKSGSEPIIYASLFYMLEMTKQVPSVGGAAGWDFWLALYTGSPNHPAKYQQIVIPQYVAHQYAGDVDLQNQVGKWDLDAVYSDNIDVLRMPRSKAA